MKYALKYGLVMIPDMTLRRKEFSKRVTSNRTFAPLVITKL